MSDKEVREYVEQEIDTLGILKEKNKDLSFKDGVPDPDALMIKTYYDRMCNIISVIEKN